MSLQREGQGMVRSPRHWRFRVLAGGAGLFLASLLLAWRYGLSTANVLHLARRIALDSGMWALLLFSAFGTGSLAIRFLGLPCQRTAEAGLFAVALGLGFLSLLVLFFGAIRLLYSWLAWVLLLVTAAGGVWRISCYRTGYLQMLRRIRAVALGHWSLLQAVLLVVLGLSVLYPLLGYALVPPLSWDEVAYHLAIPKMYIQAHRVTYVPFIPYSNWPLGSEMLFTMGLLLDSETLPHLVSWTALLLVCLGIWLFGRRYLGNTVGLLSAVVFAGTPMVGTLAGTALVELPLTLFTFLSVYAFFRWMERDERTWLVLSALSGGFAASMKLNGALVPLVLGVLVAGRRLAQSPRNAWSVLWPFTLYGMVSFVVVSPWFAKAWIQTGNPFWPFFQDVFGGRYWDALGTEYLMGFIQLVNMPSTLQNWAFGLWHLTADASRFGPYRVSLGWFYLVLLPACVPACVPHWLCSSRPRRRVLAWLSLIALLLYTAWFFQTHQARFLLPVLPLLASLGASGVAWLWAAKPDSWRVSIQAVLLVSLIAASWLCRAEDRETVLSRLPYLIGNQTRDEFLAAFAPGYAAYRYANEHLPENSLVSLALYESRGYYLDRAYMWMNPISQRLLRLEDYSDAKSLAKEMVSMGFTHILFAPERLERYEYIRYGEQYTELALNLVGQHGQLLYETPDLVLYALKP